MVDTDAAGGVGFASLDASGAGVGDPGVAWSPLDVLRPEWAEGVEMAHSWATARDAGLSGAQTRRARRAAPARLISYQTGATRRDEPGAVLSAMLRACHAVHLTPLWCEQTRLTQAIAGSASGGDQRLHCDTSDRLFFPGARVLVIRTPRGKYGRTAPPIGLAGNDMEVLTIRSSGSGGSAPITSTRLRVVEECVNDYPAGSSVVPLMESEPVDAVTLGTMGALGPWLRGGVAFRSASPSVRASALPGVADDAAWPAGAATYGGLPIFDLWPDSGQSAAVGVAREVARTALGPGGEAALLLRGDRATLTTRMAFAFFRRADAARMRAWFDAARGATHPFWLVSPRWRFMLALDAGQTTIGGSGLPLHVLTALQTRRLAPLPWRPGMTIAVVRSVGGARVVLPRTVLGISDTTINGQAAESLTLDSDLPSIPVGEVELVAVLSKARFAGDEMRERWITTRHSRVEAEFSETIREQAVDLSIPTACSTGTYAAAGACGCAAPGGGSVVPCSGSPAREGPLDLATGGALTACAASGDGFVVSTAGQLTCRVRLNLRMLQYGLSGLSSLLRYMAVADIDATVSVTPASNHEAATSAWQIVSGPAVIFRWGVWAAGAGPSSEPDGTAGVVAVTFSWQRVSGVRSLEARVGGFTDSSLATQYMDWRVKVGSDGSVETVMATLAPLSTLFGGFTAQCTQPAGVTALAATYRHPVPVLPAPSEFVGEFSAYLCPVLRCS